MADEIVITKEKVQTRKIKVKNVSTVGNRLIFGADLKQHLLGPGQEAEIEVAEPEAVRIEERSKAGSDIRVEGHDPEEPAKPEGAPEAPPEHASRAALAEKEAEVMEQGQEADKERRERDAKKSGPQLAAETGIHMHARGETPHVVAMPPDAPPKKKA
jgi:hypothetical protein